MTLATPLVLLAQYTDYQRRYIRLWNGSVTICDSMSAHDTGSYFSWARGGTPSDRFGGRGRFSSFGLKCNPLSGSMHVQPIVLSSILCSGEWKCPVCAAKSQVKKKISRQTLPSSWIPGKVLAFFIGHGSGQTERERGCPAACPCTMFGPHFPETSEKKSICAARHCLYTNFAVSHRTLVTHALKNI